MLVADDFQAGGGVSPLPLAKASSSPYGVVMWAPGSPESPESQRLPPRGRGATPLSSTSKASTCRRASRVPRAPFQA